MKLRIPACGRERARSLLSSAPCLLSLLLFLPLGAGTVGAADTITETFQRALFEEEANQNPQAAIKAFQEVIGRMDEQRKLAATAVFRLGECYRKLGQTNEATAQYQRILRVFADQATLVTLSRQNLAGLGAVAAPLPASGGESETVRALERQLVEAKGAWSQLRSTYNQLANLDGRKLKLALPLVTPDPILASLMDLELKTEMRLEELQQKYGNDHPEVKGALATLEKVLKQVNERMEGILQAMKARLAAEEARVSELTKELEQAKAAGPVGASALSLAARQGQKRLLEEELKLIEEQLADVKKMFQSGTTSRASVIDKEREVLVLKRQLALLDGVAGPVAKKPPQEAEADVEEKEVQRLQALIKDSPDLINARDSNGQTPLLKAAMLGQARVVRFLLTNHANLTAQSNGKVSLHWAAENGHKAVVELLLENGADAGTLSSSRQTALHLAAQRGYRAVAEVLVARQAPLNAADRAGATPLHLAVLNGFPAMAELLLAKGAPVDANQFESGEPRGAFAGVPRLRSEGAPLHLAAASGDTALMSLLLSNKATVDVRNASGHTPLHLAVGRSHLRAAQLLLEAGANPNAQPEVDPNPGWTPLHLAVQANQNEMVRMLLSHHAEPNVKTGTNFEGDGLAGWTPLLMAVSKGYSDIVELLLGNKADPNAREQAGQTALWLAVINHDKPLAELLLRNGADPNLRSVEDRTCLARAVELRNLELTELLLSRQADPNLTNKYGWAPLHMVLGESADEARRSSFPGPRPGALPAIGTTGPAGGHPPRPPAASLVDLARLLITHKADVNLRDRSGKSPLNLLGVPPRTATETQTALAQLLREHGALEGVPEPPTSPATIRAWREGLWEARLVFSRDTNGLNRFTLMEALRQFYSSTRGADGSFYRGVVASSGAEDQNFDFPDWHRVEIRRPESGGRYRQTTVDLLDATNGVDCAKDLDLEFGDLVVIPEREHALNERAVGMTTREAAELGSCCKRSVQLIVKGKSHEVPLHSGENRYLSRWLGRSEAMAVLVSSSDLSRVVVRRRTPDKGFKSITSGWLQLAVGRQDPESGAQPLEFKADVSAFRRSGLPGSEDLLLRGGDEIEVPDRN